MINNKMINETYWQRRRREREEEEFNLTDEEKARQAYYKWKDKQESVEVASE